MKKLINGIQHYAWGSHSALTELYGIENPDNQPMAELWMGAHPLCSSKVEINGHQLALRELIAQSPNRYLGENVNQQFGELPFLFKVLCAGQPLSIQVHPSKKVAEVGFAKENLAGIPLNAAERNYKDANHKPELVYALTPFKAMNGFRRFDEISKLLEPVADAHPSLVQFIEQPDSAHLSSLFATLLALSGQEKQQALVILKQQIQQQKGEPWQTIGEIAEYYPDDMGLFSPLLLNVITLQPGEAMFLYAETPHAYLQGSGLEVMANSDNVLRAGLTPKYIDIPELIANVEFVAKPFETLKMAGVEKLNVTTYPIPVDDFAFSIHQLSDQDVNHQLQLSQESAAILFCMLGSLTIRYEQQIITLKPGESCFIAANESLVTVNGIGRFARVYNTLE